VIYDEILRNICIIVRPHQSDDSDDSSMDDLSDIDTRPANGKSIAQRTREELTFSDDGGEEEDDEVLLAHREEMVQFMIDVHRRRKRVIEQYEKKEAVSCKRYKSKKKELRTKVYI
jgi:DNA helicase INO80